MNTLLQVLPKFVRSDSDNNWSESCPQVYAAYKSWPSSYSVPPSSEMSFKDPLRRFYITSHKKCVYPSSLSLLLWQLCVCQCIKHQVATLPSTRLWLLLQKAWFVSMILWVWAGCCTTRIQPHDSSACLRVEVTAAEKSNDADFSARRLRMDVWSTCSLKIELTVEAGHRNSDVYVFALVSCFKVQYLVRRQPVQ